MAAPVIRGRVFAYTNISDTIDSAGGSAAQEGGPRGLSECAQESCRYRQSSSRGPVYTGWASCFGSLLHEALRAKVYASQARKRFCIKLG